MRMKAVKAVLVLFILATLALITVAAPYGPDTVTRVSDERRNFSTIGAKSVSAQAGNVTQLTINVTTLTKRWQGYYGNITGYVTLDDASGNTMYDCGQDTGVSVVGEIFAANYTISDWNDVVCVNLTANGTGLDGGSLLNVTTLETMYGMNPNDVDGVDETFTSTEDITIGTTTLADCPATNMYVNNASQSDYWNETLLTENQTTTVIFAAKVDQDTNGFNNRIWDFQMIVGEDGDVDGATTYYFYVELT